MKSLMAAISVLFLAALLGTASPARAETTFQTSPPENNYPKSVIFRANIESDQTITDVTLRFSLKNRGQSGFGKPDSFTPAASQTASVVINTDPETSWLPVGNEFSYFWEATLADGSVIESPREDFLYLPPERDWRNVQNDIVTVWYYGERTNTATGFLDAASDVYTKLGQEVLNGKLEHVPVKVILFVGTDEVAESQPSKGATVEASGIVTCGYRPGTADDIIVVAARCGGSSTDTFRHEFGHILNAAAGESALVKLPAWLDEGLAVYAQDKNDFDSAFRSRLRRGDLLPFDRLSLVPSNPDDTLLFYGQAHAMVSYLIDTYGKAKMAELMSLTSSGKRFDVAFKEGYGIDMKAFEEAFRAANGLPPAGQTGATPNPTPSNTRRPNATATPAAQGSASSGQSDDGLDPFLLGSIGAAVLFALVAILLLLWATMLGNRRTVAGAQRGESEGASPESQPKDRDQSRWGRPD